MFTSPSPCVAHRGVGSGLEQRDELLGRVGRRAGIVDGDEVDAPAVGRAERHHQPEEVRIGFRVRAPEAVRHAADADERRRAGRLEDAEAVEFRRQLFADVQEDLAGAELRLVRAAIRLCQLG